ALTLVRAPYGNPYFGPQSRLDQVAPIIAHHGVHIGWNIDSDDWKCASEGHGWSCAYDNVMGQVHRGYHGIVLMHCLYGLTVDALPHVIHELRHEGYHFVTVESLVHERFGTFSPQVHAHYLKTHAH